MDIQRGDQVYYRGEVWTVQDKPRQDRHHGALRLCRPITALEFSRCWARPEHVQRVEQV